MDKAAPSFSRSPPNLLPMIDKRAVRVLSQSFGKPGTQLGGGQGTYTDSSSPPTLRSGTIPFLAVHLLDYKA